MARERTDRAGRTRHADARRAELPERPGLEGLEEKWGGRWEAAGTYHFADPGRRAAVYSIDTPPPTVSGSLHIGHVFSYTQTDILARFWRMQDKAVFYPIGWDDNGLATERRVQNYYGVRCIPGTPPTPDLVPPGAGTKEPLAISRPEFVELCRKLTLEDEGAFEDLFRRVGLSVDWRLAYTTISERAQRISQRGFLELFAQGHVYRREAPTLWDVDFRTAVAQAELVDKEVPGAYHRLAFERADGQGRVEIETTRPELVPACVALVAHPEDPRYQPLFGSRVRTPLFGVEIPVLAHRLADPDKGSGIAMVCTFGDLTDVTWWRELDLPTRTVIGRDGRLGAAPFGEAGWESADVEGARRTYAELEGKTAAAARRRIVELFAEAGVLSGQPRTITHPVKYYEKGDRPLEIVASSQWFIRTMDLKAQLVADGRAIDWHPEYMRARYEDWVEGLSGDWNISRQRFFGVPFPLWYPIGNDGSIDHDHPILAPLERLPVDPSAEVPEGYAESQRHQPGGFVEDPDVMDTWATSSLTPQIAAGWGEGDEDRLASVFPMDLRPQAHDIIRTWLFSTVVRSRLGFGEVPWRNAALSGWILDPDRKKMSKSLGNVVVPSEPLEAHGADAVRYWAASARLAADTAFTDQQMRIGRRLAIKLLNASRFVLSRLGEPAALGGAIASPLDLSVVGELDAVLKGTTAALVGYDHARALELVEQFFWTFCDDYLELVKGRAYDEDGGADAVSARATLALSLSVLLRCFAPFLPYVTEEVWSWWHEESSSVHLAPWPEPEELARACAVASIPSRRDGEAAGVLAVAGHVLGEIRRAKTTAKQSMRARARLVEVCGEPTLLRLVDQARRELVDAGGIETLELIDSPDAKDGGQAPLSSLTVRVELAEEPK